MKKNITATTVKIEKSLYEDFKVLGIRHKLQLQTFFDRCVHLYVNDEPFRTIVDGYIVPILNTTGSFKIV